MGPLMLPSVIYMAVVFLGFGTSSDIWKEKNGGALRRLLTTPGSVGSFLGGKLIAIGLVLAAVASAGLAVGRWLTGMDIQSFVVAVCWIILTGPVFYLALMIVHVHVGRERAASILTNVIVMTFAMVGGSFFPFEVMPSFLANIGRMTPNGWALEQLKAIMNGEMGAAALAPRVAAVIAVGGLAFWIVARRIRRGFVA
jgi:ABC-2 type transport system permease protein